MIQEGNIVWEQPNNYFDNMSCVRNVEKHQQTDLDSENEKRTSWGLEDDDDEQQLRQELIQRATARLRRRLLEQGLQDVMSQVVSLQTQLETLRLDAATTIDTISGLFDDDDEKPVEGSQKMNRQMDVLERRLEAHKAHLQHFAPTVKPEQQQQKKNQPIAEPTTKSEPTPLTALSMSRLSSLSLVSSIFGRSSIASGSSRATSVSDRCYLKEEHCCQENMSSLEDDDCISQIENISGLKYYQQQQQQQCIEQEEDHPFYDLAGKRSFKAGSFCGSVYHDNDQEQQYQLPSQYENTAEIRWRRRQRRQRHQKHLEQQQQQHYFSDNESSTSDNVSTFSSISGYSNVNVHSRHQNNMYHPLSPVTPPPNYLADGNYFHQFMQQDSGFYKDLTQPWFTSANFNECTQESDWANSILQKTNIFPDRNVLDEAMSFLDGLSENGDDGGFGEDMYLLLKNPDLCCKPLSEIQSTIHELRQQEKPKDVSVKNYLLDMVNPIAWCQMGIQLSTDAVYKATCSSLQWCRFLSVLAAAVVISILKGPEDIRRHSAAF